MKGLLSEAIVIIADRLSDEMEDRIAYITGKKSRHSVAEVSRTELFTDWFNDLGSGEQSGSGQSENDEINLIDAAQKDNPKSPKPKV